MHKDDEIIAANIMDIIGVLIVSKITLKIRKTTCNFPDCIILMSNELTQTVKIVDY